MRIPNGAGRDCKIHEILRLRRMARFARRPASLRVTVLRGVLGLVLLSSAPLWSTSYYVSASGGNDANPGTQAQPFQTMAKVNGLALAAGDTVFLKRGDVWNEQLIPPTSGAPGSPIAFDAYGSGAAPVLSPVINLSSATWTHNSGSIYTTPLSTSIATPQINSLQLGNFWGRKRTPNPACTTAGVITGPGDFCLVYPTLYVYSPNGTLPSSYYGAITAVVGQASGLAVISVVNKSWLVFQHIKIQMFDYMGVSVSGTSDNLVFANMESDGMVPYGTTPHGFYVNAPNASSIQLVNDDAHLDYDGFHVDGAAAVTMTNCRGYANRDAGLKDNSGHVTYSYSHFYGNNVAQFPTSDVVGAVAGSGNISSSIAPILANFKTYPARFSFTVDDVGSAPGTETYIDSFVSMFSTRGIHFNAAVVPSYPVVWSDVNSWYAGGNEIDSHSWSHQYYTTNTNPCGIAPCSPPYPNAPAMVIQYTGGGTAATLTIAGGQLTTSVTGATGDNLSIPLASYNALTLYQYLQGIPHYSVQQNSPLWTTNNWPLSRPNTHVTNLLAITSQDIKSAPYALLYDQTELLPDEMASSKSALQENVTGLTENFYVYPDGIEDPSTEAYAVAAGYTAARGSLAMKGQDNTAGSANSLYSNGVNVQNITSLAAITIHGMSQDQINQMVASLVFRAAAWGVPYGFFTHYNSRSDGTPDISNTELGYLLDAVTANGGAWMTNTGLASAISAGIGIGGTTRYVLNATGASASFAVVAANSPTVGRGTASSYSVDMNGTDRAGLGTWDVGAAEYVSQRYGKGGGSGSTFVGSMSGSGPSATFATGLLGGVEATVINPSSGPTVVCFTVDGSTPATKGDGATCSSGMALQPTLSGTPNPGYVALATSAPLKMVSGTNGSVDSAVVSYAVNVPAQTVQASHFGAQCGLGVTNCGNTNPPPYLVWPASAAMPRVLRLHDAKTFWAALQPTSASDWVSTYLDNYLDMLAAHPGQIGVEQFTTTPIWDVINTATCGNVGVYGPSACTDPPEDLGATGSTTFNAFVTKLVQYCHGANCVKDLIKVYQMSNEWTLTIHWTGTMAQMYQMVASAAAIIRANVPGAVLMMPSVTSGHASDLQTWMNYENANGRISDIVDWHTYTSSNSAKTPEQAWSGQISSFRTVQNGTAGWNVAPYIDSETNFSTSSFACPASGSLAGLAVNAGGSGYKLGDFFTINQAGGSGGIGAVVQVSGTTVTYVQIEAIGSGYTSASGVATTDSTTPAASGLTVNVTSGPFAESDCAGQLARWQIVHESNGAAGLWWYYWNATIGNGPTTPVSYATVYQNLEGMLVGGYFTAAAVSDGNNPATWTAPFVDANGRAGLWVWTDSVSGGKSYTVPGAYSGYRDLMGGTGTLSGNLTITTMPMLLQ